MGTVFPYKGRWRFKFKDAAGEWRTVTSKARTKVEARSELHEKELEVERQNLGLAPRAINPEGWTVADLMRWWLDTYSRHQAAHVSNEGTIRCHILGAPVASKLLEHVRPGDVEQLLQSKEGQVAPGTINHIRQFFVRGFNKARKAGKWHGGNPAEDVDTRRVPESIVNILAPEEVVPVLRRARAGPAASVRGGDLHGLPQGRAVRAPEGRRRPGAPARHGAALLRAARSRRASGSAWSRSRRSSCRSLRTRSAATKGPWLFPDEPARCGTRPGSRRTCCGGRSSGRESSPGYTHVCRRKTCRFSEEREDGEIPALPAVRVQALAEGEGPGDPLPRSPAHLRERAVHARGAARLGAEAARALGSEDHGAAVRAPLAGLHEVGGGPAAVRDRPARACTRGLALRQAQGERVVAEQSGLRRDFGPTPPTLGANGDGADRGSSGSPARPAAGIPLVSAVAHQKERPGPHRFPVKSRPLYWRGVGDLNPWPPA